MYKKQSRQQLRLPLCSVLSDPGQAARHTASSSEGKQKPVSHRFSLALNKLEIKREKAP